MKRAAPAMPSSHRLPLEERAKRPVANDHQRGGGMHGLQPFESPEQQGGALLFDQPSDVENGLPVIAIGGGKCFQVDADVMRQRALGGIAGPDGHRAQRVRHGQKQVSLPGQLLRARAHSASTIVLP